MRQKHVILKFDYEDWGTWTTLFSTIKFPERIHDVKFIELVNFSPSSVLLTFTCDAIDKSHFFSNFEENVLAMGLGGVSGETRSIARVDPAKSNMSELTLRMFHPGRGAIYSNRRNFARAHVIIHFGEDEGKEKSMRETHFLLKVFPEGENRKIHSVNFKLPKALHGVKFIKVVNWFASGRYDFICCTLVKETCTVSDDPALRDGLIAFGVGGVSKRQEKVKVKDSCGTLNELPISIERVRGSAFSFSHSIVHLAIFHE